MGRDAWEGTESCGDKEQRQKLPLQFSTEVRGRQLLRCACLRCLREIVWEPRAKLDGVFLREHRYQSWLVVAVQLPPQAEKELWWTVRGERFHDHGLSQRSPSAGCEREVRHHRQCAPVGGWRWGARSVPRAELDKTQL